MSKIIIEVQVDSEEILHDVSDTYIKKYAKEYLDLTEDLDEWEDSDLIEHLEYKGYEIVEKENLETLDSVDQNMLDEIITKFYNASWAQRKELHGKII